MIKYNSNTINEWNYGSDNIIKVYRNNAVCYYKITGGGDVPTAQTPCYAVVNDISQYSDTEFVDVYNKADDKWYKLNNLNQYEQYGVYGSGRNITTYEGKLTIDDGYEYQYSGGSWVNVGEVSGSSISDNYVIPFEDSAVKAICVNNWGGNVVAGELTYGEAKQVTSIGTVFANNTSITKFNELAYFHGLTTLNEGHFVGCSNLIEIVIPANVTSIGRVTSSGSNIIFKGCSNLSGLTILSGDISLYFSINAESNSYYMNSSHSSTPIVFPNRPMEFSSNMFAYYDYCTTAYFQSSIPPTNLANSDISNYRKLANVYCPVGSLSAYQTALNGLSKTVIEYDFETDSLGLLNKEKEWTSKTSEQSVYPLYYDEIQDPPSAVTFSSMTEAESMECPYVGLQATIAGDRYIFSGDSTSGYEWVEITTPYTELTYIQCSTASSRGGVQLLNTPKEGLLIEMDFEMTGTTSSGDILIIGQKDSQETVSYQMGFMQYSSWSNGYYDYGGGRLSFGSCPSFTTRRTWKIGRISGSTSPSIVGYYCEGTVSTKSVSTLQFDANRPYNIGNIKYNGSSTPVLDGSNIKPMKLYSVKIYEDYGETLVGDYIPVIKEDGTTVTLYDKVSGKYANPVGTIIAGDPV